MARFKIGQKVVAIRANSTNNITKGNIYTIEGFNCCPKCGDTNVFLIEKKKVYSYITCVKSRGGCGHVDLNARDRYDEKLFAPLANTADAIEYKMKVSIPELIEIKETQLQ